jgi:hypothetical protein
LCLLVFSLVVGSVGKHAIDAWSQQAAQPVSAAETIMISRQTSPVTTGNRNSGAWFGAGLLALVLVVIGAMLFTMRGGSELLRQWRLSRKRSRQHQQPVPYLPELFGPDIPQIRSARFLPEVDDEQMVDSGH